ncbi:HEAT repeat protein [Orenia metallireducens]|uniref:HEAT repeat n=1 Tax=Orenia metallireducens TaxID=1413210 RepID=A0A285F5N6_9FIRM|nr:HEAT repeat domain-containing protein [Orenia metallireducens]PRX34882.1 HEAT repeat protein [Orenia metallireducens]SNY06024.1 HEAT repeat [Orenia metallireducens]
MEIPIFMQNTITLLLENLITTLVIIITILVISRWIIKKIKNKKSYSYIERLLKEDLLKGLEKLNKSKDIEIKKKLLSEGKQSLGKSLYQEVKEELINNGVIDELFNELVAKDETKRGEACEILVKLNTPQAIDYAITSLYDQSNEVKKIAIESLAELVNSKIIETFIEYLSYCDNELVLSKLTKAFEKIGDLAFEQLVEVAFTKKEVYRSWAIKLLSNMNYEDRQDEEIINIFSNLLNDKSEMIRVQAIKAIAKFKDSQGVFDNLIDKLEDNNCEVRSQAAKILGEYGKEDAVPKLFTLITDSSGMVRMNAYHSLIKLGDKGFEYLLKATRIKETKTEALQVLKELDMEKVIDNINRIYELGDKMNDDIREELSLDDYLKEEQREFQIIG